MFYSPERLQITHTNELESSQKSFTSQIFHLLSSSGNSLRLFVSAFVTFFKFPCKQRPVHIYRPAHFKFTLGWTNTTFWRSWTEKIDTAGSMSDWMSLFFYFFFPVVSECEAPRCLWETDPWRILWKSDALCPQVGVCIYCHISLSSPVSVLRPSLLSVTAMSYERPGGSSLLCSTK